MPAPKRPQFHRSQLNAEEVRGVPKYDIIDDDGNVVATVGTDPDLLARLRTAAGLPRNFAFLLPRAE